MSVDFEDPCQRVAYFARHAETVTEARDAISFPPNPNPFLRPPFLVPSFISSSPLPHPDLNERRGDVARLAPSQGERGEAGGYLSSAGEV